MSKMGSAEQGRRLMKLAGRHAPAADIQKLWDEGSPHARWILLYELNQYMPESVVVNILNDTRVGMKWLNRILQCNCPIPTDRMLALIQDGKVDNQDKNTIENAGYPKDWREQQVKALYKRLISGQKTRRKLIFLVKFLTHTQALEVLKVLTSAQETIAIEIFQEVSDLPQEAFNYVSKFNLLGEIGSSIVNQKNIPDFLLLQMASKSANYNWSSKTAEKILMERAAAAKRVAKGAVHVQLVQ